MRPRVTVSRGQAIGMGITVCQAAGHVVKRLEALAGQTLNQNPPVRKRLQRRWSLSREVVAAALPAGLFGRVHVSPPSSFCYARGSMTNPKG